MKLYHTHNSPYARRIRVALRETGLLEMVEENDVNPIADNLATLLEHGASGKVPLLVTNDGRALCETLIIARHLNDVSGGRLYSNDASLATTHMEIEGLASALMDTLFVRSHEKRRDPALISQAALDKELARARRLYDALEPRVALFGDRVHMDTISVGSALGYADGRHPDDGWRDGHPQLAAWFERFSTRASMAETTPAF